MPEGENAGKGLWTIVRQHFRADFFTSQADHNNLASFVTDDGGLTYNLCHVWSNFEIADLDIFRSEQYQAYFNLWMPPETSFMRGGEMHLYTPFMWPWCCYNHLRSCFWIPLGTTISRIRHVRTMKGARKVNRCLCDSKEDWNWHTWNSCGKEYLKMQSHQLPPGIVW
ncbi:hypothetical protein LIPSTDRAFT_74562 [Lipomyces starkeyi NRRL Y-11557]|uniref:Uncharacterized protein n=1 Tax=Lipomyces starkeyi NRRL Y-11557 TaxID=675824 RepID=A0A1E3PY29_LIPST|nr:hypothetical protein LIPSTDRAFT_74562 [Lipomyces starkeyi NRRL Y-11557]